MSHWALGQEDAYSDDETGGEVSTDTPTTYNSDSPYPEVKTQFGIQSFQNQTLRLQGYSYDLTVGLWHPKKYWLYLEAPYLYGQLRGIERQELGNPVLGGEAMFTQISSIEIWGQASGKLSRPSAYMASRYDSYRLGADLRFERSSFGTRMGGGYTFRVEEQDRQVDVGNVTDFHFALSKRLFSSWSAFGELLWYRSQGVKSANLVFARETEWAGLHPGVKYRFMHGLEASLGAIFPVMGSRGQQETEISLWEIGFPRVSDVTFISQLGAAF